MGEIRISLKDILYRLALKWRMLIVVGLVFAVLGAGLSYIVTKRASEKEIAANSKIITADMKEDTLLKEIDKNKTTLSDIEIDNAEMVYSSYVQTSTQKRQITNYLNNSIKMQLNPESTPTIYLSYSVDTHYEVTYPVIQYDDPKDEILRNYQILVFSDELFNDISEVFNWNSADTKELLSAVIADSILKITIIAPSKEDCELISTLIQKRMDAIKPSLTEVYSDFDISLVGNVYTEVAYPDIISTRQSYLANINSLTTYYNNQLKLLTESEKNYVNALINHYTYKTLLEKSEELEAASVETKSEKKSSAQGKISTLYVLIAVVGGLFVVIVLEFLCYIFNPSVKTELDLEETLGLNLVGAVSVTSKKKLLSCVDKALTSLFYKRRLRVSDAESYKLAATAIKISVARLGCSSIVITGASVGDLSDEAVSQLKSELNMDNCEVSSVKSIFTDAEAFEKYASACGVVLVEKLGESRFDEISKEIAIAKENDVKILGTVAIY